MRHYTQCSDPLLVSSHHIFSCRRRLIDVKTCVGLDRNTDGPKQLLSYFHGMDVLAHTTLNHRSDDANLRDYVYISFHD
jgi:hypothetical protein